MWNICIGATKLEDNTSKRIVQEYQGDGNTGSA